MILKEKQAYSEQIVLTPSPQLAPEFGEGFASYLTNLPPRLLLQWKLHDAVLLAGTRLEVRPGPVTQQR